MTCGSSAGLSVVGTGRWPDSGYFRAKVAQEKLIIDFGLLYSIVHATRFYTRFEDWLSATSR